MQQVLEGPRFTKEQEERHICDMTQDSGVWFLPLCHQQHWLFLRIVARLRVIEQYNSLRTPSRQHFGQHIIGPIQRYTKQMWSLNHVLMPQQQNGYDCGLYLLAEIQFLQKLRPRSQAEVPSRQNLQVLLLTDIKTKIYKKQSESQRKRKRYIRNKGIKTDQDGVKRAAMIKRSPLVQPHTQEYQETRISPQTTPQHHPWEYDNYIGDVMRNKPEGIIRIYS